jgi:hypothetical protein
MIFSFTGKKEKRKKIEKQKPNRTTIRAKNPAVQ